MSIDVSQSFAERDFDRFIILAIMRHVGNPSISIRLWNGDEFPVTEQRSVACMEFRERRAVFELLRSPSLGFGECYSKGLIEIHGDFLAFMNEVAAAITRKHQRSYYGHKIRSMLYAMRRNSPARSQHNVHHHYDLGNEFYKLWLDERMVYTCAYYDTPTASLAEAQVAMALGGSVQPASLRDPWLEEMKKVRVTRWLRRTEARQLLGEGRTKEARAMFEAILADYPGRVDLMNDLASAYMADELDEEALVLLERALKLDSEFGLTYLHLASVLAKRGRHAEAVGHAQAAVKKLPRNIRASIVHARLLMKLKRFEETVIAWGSRVSESDWR